MYRSYLLGLIIMFAAFAPQPAAAIPPPDVIFQLGSQFFQLFSIFFLMAGAIGGVAVRWFSLLFHRARQTKWLVLMLIVLVPAVSLLGAYGISRSLQQPSDQELDAELSAQLESKIDEYDALGAGEETIEGDLTKEQEFIKQYYQNLVSDIDAAYAVSKKSVSLEVFRGWYADTSKVEVFGIELLDSGEYAIDVALHEGGVATRYAVVMTLEQSAAGFVIGSSKVRVIEDENDSELALVVTNEEFETMGSGTFVLDAREDEEYELGRYRGSKHIRFADLLAGEWVQLPQDTEVIVLCWSGIRGREVAQFLREKGVLARYVEDGANGWVEYGGAWDGEITFTSYYSATRYTTTLSTQTVRDRVVGGAILVDARDANRFNQGHIPGAINISAIFTATDELNAQLRAVEPGSTVITICDDFMSCFDAKIVGIKLEKLGHTFLGRYSKPYEY